jgi:Ca2+-binding EF-hand superfamily protein
MHASFTILDRDDDGFLSIDEFLEAVGADRTDFAAEIFLIFDHDSDKKIDFSEFVSSCTRICSSDQRALARFAFRIIDGDNSGTLNRDEIQKIFSVIYGHLVNEHDMVGIGWRHNIRSENQQTSVAAVLDVIDRNGDGQLSVAEFIQSASKFPHAIEPAFALQLRLRKKIMGVSFWDLRSQEFRHRFDELVGALPDNGTSDWWGPFAKFGVEEGSRKTRKARKAAARSSPFQISPDSHLYIKRGNSRSEEVKVGGNRKQDRRYSAPT